MLCDLGRLIVPCSCYIPYRGLPPPHPTTFPPQACYVSYDVRFDVHIDVNVCGKLELFGK